MNWLDFGIVLFLLASLVRGNEVGFVRQFCSTFGFFLGLILGAWLQGKFITLVSTPSSKALLVLFITLGCALTLMTLGEYIGLRLKFKIRRAYVTDRLDRIFGSLIAGITVLAAVWLGATIFRNVPSDGWQRQISGSRIVAGLNNTLPPLPSLISKLGHLIDPNSFPQVFTGLEPKLPSDAALPDLGDLQSAVEKARKSIVKMSGSGCGGTVEGSGFVAAENLVVTSAHVVAGVAEPKIVDTTGSHDARVLWFDPELDLAILRTDQIAGDPLVLKKDTASNGTAGAVLGYPESAGFTASPAVILDSFNATGRDIYNQNTTTRHIYSVKSDIRQGNSGGPLISADGSVVGVIFAESVSYDDIGYALNMEQVIEAVEQASQKKNAVSTGSCAG